MSKFKVGDTVTLQDRVGAQEYRVCAVFRSSWAGKWDDIVRYQLDANREYLYVESTLYAPRKPLVSRTFVVEVTLPADQQPTAEQLRSALTTPALNVKRDEVTVREQAR